MVNNNMCDTNHAPPLIVKIPPIFFQPGCPFRTLLPSDRAPPNDWERTRRPPEDRSFRSSASTYRHVSTRGHSRPRKKTFCSKKKKSSAISRLFRSRTRTAPHVPVALPVSPVRRRRKTPPQLCPCAVCSNAPSVVAIPATFGSNGGYRR